jgi:hypothetical protein
LLVLGLLVSQKAFLVAILWSLNSHLVLVLP